MLLSWALNFRVRVLLKGVVISLKSASFSFQFRMPIAMIEGPDYLRLADSSLDSVISSGIRVLGDPGHFVYDEFDKLPVATYYWFLGKQFRGDMVSNESLNVFNLFCTEFIF